MEESTNTTQDLSRIPDRAWRAIFAFFGLALAGLYGYQELRNDIGILESDQKKTEQFQQYIQSRNEKEHSDILKAIQEISQ